MRTAAGSTIEDADAEIAALLGPTAISDTLEDVRALLGPAETIQREAVQAEVRLREALGIPASVDLYAVLALISRRRRDTSLATAASRRVRRLQAQQRACRVSGLARDLGAHDADDRLVWSFERLAGALYASGIRSRRGTKLTATSVRRDLLRCGMIRTKASDT